MSLETRREVVLARAREYRMASKKDKSKILKEICNLTGYHPKYAQVVLKRAFLEPEKFRTQTLGKVKKRKRRGKYNELEKAALAKLWRISGYLCGKLLAAFITENLEHLIRQGSLMVSDETACKLLEVSPATIDRLLSCERVSMRRRRNTTTNPALLKNLVPLALDYERPPEPGHLQVDLVAHCGGNPSGDFVYTLTATDLYTGWTEVCACLGKSRKAVFEALEKTFSAFPFKIKSFQTDNGAEFLNAHLIMWSKRTGIDYIKSRPHKKEENAYVEERNGHLVRKFVGYLRLDTPEEKDALNQAYEALIPLHNLFIPRRICLRKERKGSRVKRFYDKPQTPLRRAIPFLGQEQSRNLLNIKQSLNPQNLLESLERITNGLYRRRAMKARRHRETLSCGS